MVTAEQWGRRVKQMRRLTTRSKSCTELDFEFRLSDFRVEYILFVSLSLLLPLGWRRRSRVFGSLMLVSNMQYYFLVSLSLPPTASRWTEEMRDGGWSWWDKVLEVRVTRIFLSRNQRERLVMRAVSVESMWRRSPCGNKERREKELADTRQHRTASWYFWSHFRRRQELGKNQATMFMPHVSSIHFQKILSLPLLSFPS